MKENPSKPYRVDDRHALKASLLIFGSFLLGYNLANIVHEFGHAFSSVLCGGRSFTISSHPFTWSYAHSVGGGGALFSWGGFLWSDVLAFVVFSALYGLRRPSLFPILFWCSLALLVNGIYFAAGSLIGVGDPSSLVFYGYGPFLLSGIGMLSLMIGGSFAVASIGSLGVHRPIFSRTVTTCVVSFPVLVYLSAILIYTWRWNSNEIGVWGAFAAVGAAASYALSVLVYYVGARFTRKVRVPITWKLVIATNAAGVAIIIAQLTILSEERGGLRIGPW